MSQQNKLLRKFLNKPADFSWNELVKLLRGFSFDEIKMAKTGGSRRKFYREGYPLISLHEPHPKKVLKKYQIEQIIELLKKEDLI